MTDSLSIAVHAFASRVLMSVSFDETLLQKITMTHTYRQCKLQQQQKFWKC